MTQDLLILIPFVAAIAFTYSSVGLGGGSSYTALLTIAGVTYSMIPSISLTLNVIVTAGATIQFTRRGHLKWAILWPFLFSSVPMAWVGGRLQLAEETFQLLLLGTLVLVAVRIYFWRDPVFDLPDNRPFKVTLSLVLGALLGFVAGTVGIGGGIYLVPIILMTGIGSSKEAAAAGAAFILINSVTGLMSRASWAELPWDMIWPLAVTVAVAGWAGGHMGSSRWSARGVQRVLGLVILIAIVLLANRLFLA